MEELKARTREIHVRTERRPLGYAMATGTIDPRTYRLYLLGMRGLLGELEGQVAECGDARVASVRRHTRSALPAIDADLTALRGDAGALLDLWSTATRPVVAESALGLLGWLYVMEGSQLGGVVLARRVGPALGLEQGDPGLLYLSGPPDLRSRWKSFKDAMNDTVEHEDIDRVVGGAHRAFHSVGELFDAVYEAVPQTGQRRAG